MIKHGKYLFPSYKIAKDFKDSLTPTEENLCKHQSFGFKQEKTKEAVIEDGEIVEDAEYSDCYQLDVAWCDLPNLGTEGKPIYEHPKDWIDYVVDLNHEGNVSISGESYLKNKI